MLCMMHWPRGETNKMLDDAYGLMRDSAKIARDSAAWLDEIAGRVKDGSLKAVETGRPVIAAEQKSFSVRVTGRKYFLGFIATAFRILITGKAVLKFGRVS